MNYDARTRLQHLDDEERARALAHTWHLREGDGFAALDRGQWRRTALANVLRILASRLTPPQGGRAAARRPANAQS